MLHVLLALFLCLFLWPQRAVDYVWHVTERERQERESFERFREEYLRFRREVQRQLEEDSKAIEEMKRRNGKPMPKPMP